MLTFIARRVAAGIAMLFAVSSAAFLLLYLTGGDVARTLLGDFASEEAVRQRAAELGLDQPLHVRYWDWLTSALQGDLGDSWFAAASVNTVIGQRLGVTLTMIVIATTFTALLATVVGVWAVRRGGWVDRAVQVLSLAGAAIPNFLIALAMVMVFALQLGWFDPTGYTPPSVSVGGWIASITLPLTALLVGGVAGTAQQVRSAMIDTLDRDFVRTLRSRGLPARTVVYKHALRNAAGPGLSVLGLQFVGLIGGAVVIENLFAIPGHGSLSARSTVQGDIPVVMGVVVTVAIIVVVVNLLIDIAQGLLNPKVRVS